MTGGSANRAVLVPRETAKQALRHYGLLTAGLRAGPDFAVIGAKRGGTTSLYNYLLQHPHIQPLFPGRQRIKGVHFFDSGYAHGERWYRSHFPLAIGSRHLARPWISRPLTGEASPYYLFHPLAAERLARHCPDVRLLVVLRDPVERAYSHYEFRDPKVLADELRAREPFLSCAGQVRRDAAPLVRAIRPRALLHRGQRGLLRRPRACHQ